MQPTINFLQQHSKRLAIGVCAVAMLVLAIPWILPSTTPVPDAASPFAEGEDAFGPPEEDVAPQPTPAPPIVAYISGAVREPDVYQLPAEARIKDLVLAAGGLLESADADRINLAERITDGQHIQVPFHGDPAPASATASGSASTSGDAPLNINSASLDEFDQLEGIGKVIAQRIIDYRNANGPFKSVDELGNVKGISATLLATLAPRLSAQP